MSALSGSTTRELHRIALGRQRSGRVPGLYVGVAREGELVWGEGIGAARVDDPERSPGPDDQFLIASNTKTFTAVMVMQLRDEGRLTLDDNLDRFVPEVTHPGLTIRSCLAHVSGMQREPVGEVWETLENPDRDELVAGFNQAQRLHTAHHLFHYSNLVFSLLGEVVARLDGRDWAESLQARLLRPLEMTRTTVGFDGPHVQGYFVPPYTDVPEEEPVVDLRALAPCGGLASTARDLAKWSAFVAHPVDEVLASDTLDEMCEPLTMVDRERWTSAFGLGLMLLRSGSRTYVGHTGGMPGHITGLFTDREAGTGAMVLMNASVSPDPALFAIELADHVTEHDPVEAPPWRPGTSVPAELGELVGLWYSEGHPFVFTVREGRLEARATDLPEHKPSSVFEAISDDVYRTTAGRENGELLRVSRDAEGRVTKMSWATYLVTREPLAFGRQPAEGRAP